MSSASRGIAFELVVARAMESLGFVVASRRHTGGAGDLLGVHPDGRCWLVEAKARKNVFEGFRRADRRAMLELALPPQAELWLASKNGHLIDWTESKDWPSNGD